MNSICKCNSIILVGRQAAVASRLSLTIGRHESGEILTVLDRRKFESTTEIPNRMSGPKILGLTARAINPPFNFSHSTHKHLDYSHVLSVFMAFLWEKVTGSLRVKTDTYGDSAYWLRTRCSIRVGPRKVAQIPRLWPLCRRGSALRRCGSLT